MTIRVEDEKKQPVCDAAVHCQSQFLPPDLDRGRETDVGSFTDLQTDANGRCLLANGVEWPYTINVTHPGFQPLDYQINRLDPKRPLTLTLKPPKPIRGLVLSPQGKPVAGARVNVWWRGSFTKWQSSDPIDADLSPLARTTTDSNGRFAFDEVREGEYMAVVVIAEGTGWQKAERLSAAEGERTIRLEPELMVAGEVHGDLHRAAGDQTGRWRPGGHWVVSSRYQGSGVFKDTPIEIAGGVGRFLIRGLQPGHVVVEFGGYQLLAIINRQQPHAKVVFDLTRPPPPPPAKTEPGRLIRFHFTTPDGHALPKGTFRIYFNIDVPIANGEATYEVRPPWTATCLPIGLGGYWFKDKTISIDEGEGPVDVLDPLDAGWRHLRPRP